MVAHPSIVLCAAVAAGLGVLPPLKRTTSGHQPGADAGAVCPEFLTLGAGSRGRSAPPAAELLKRGLNAGDTEAATVALLGRPAERRVDTFTNRHTPQTDSIVRLRYPGLEVAFYKTSEAEFLGAVTLTSPGCEVLPGLSVGAPAAVLPKLLGAPAMDNVRGDSLIVQFELPDEAPVRSYLNVTALRDTIRVIQWQFGID